MLDLIIAWVQLRWSEPGHEDFFYQLFRTNKRGMPYYYHLSQLVHVLDTQRFLFCNCQVTTDCMEERGMERGNHSVIFLERQEMATVNQMTTGTVSMAEAHNYGLFQAHWYHLELKSTALVKSGMLSSWETGNTNPSKHAGSDPEAFWVRPVMAITASMQPESGWIIYAGSDFNILFNSVFPKKAWAILHKTDPNLILTAWSGFGQTHLVWKQAGVQESSGLVSGRTQPACY